MLGGDSASPLPRKGAQQPPLFGPCLLWPNGWMDQDTTCYGGQPRPRDSVLERTSSPVEICTAAPTFRSMSIVAKRSPIPATAALLFSFMHSSDIFQHFSNTPIISTIRYLMDGLGDIINGVRCPLMASAHCVVNRSK